MEAFAALGLASNIVQFVDFSGKLFLTAKEIRTSAQGSSTRVDDAAFIASHLDQLSQRLIVAAGRGNPSLELLASKCRAIASELIVLLDKIRTQQPQSKWKSFVLALKTVLSDGQIQELQDRLDDYRRQIVTALEVMQSEQQSLILRNINTMYEANSRMHAHLGHQISTLHSSIMHALEEITAELQRQDLQTILGRQNAGGASFLKLVELKTNKTEPEAKEVDIQPHLQTLAVKASEAPGISIALRLLRMLRFNAMGFRYSKIPDAHLDTFRWMFQTTFANWLNSSHPLFWISGKPGSGKSTLMKFLVDNLDLPQYLSHWAKGGRVLSASYFFWINGTEMQKSQEGFMRSLLYDILRQDSAAIQSVFPKHWQWLEAGYIEEDIPPWTRQELLDALTRLLQGGLLTSKYCIFIDGLDEYEGEHEDLIRIIHGFTQIRNVKLCIASRPWNVFEAAFGSDVAHKLYLEQFNRADIALYVRDTLEYHPDFQRIRVRDPQADALLAEITSRAQGVFLWVYLVVRSLVRGLVNRDRIVDLYRRLRAFPSDLDDFFAHILMSLEETYRVQIARAFQIALAAPRPLSLLNYWYTDAEEDDAEYCLKLPVQTVDLQELAARQDEMYKRLNGRCRGLLEVTLTPNVDPPYEWRVDFLHRTVKDFLRTTNIQQQLLRWSSNNQVSGSAFDPYLALCKSSLAELKSGPVKYGYLRGPGPTQDLISDFFFGAQQHELSTSKTPVGMIAEVERVIGKHVVTLPTQQPYYPWINWDSRDILTHAVRWNMCIYVKQAISSKRISTSEKTHLLSTALTGRFGRNGELKLGPDQQMVETLLLLGSSVSFDEKQISGILSSLGSDPSMIEGLYGCLMLLAIHGSLKVAKKAPVWDQISLVLTEAEVATLKATQREASHKRYSLRRWFSRKG